jgi:UDP-N-acetylmuramoylalanine--D-glutamate ligase
LSPIESWSKRKVTVLGLGRSGFTAAQYLRSKGAEVFLSEGGKAEGEKAAQAQHLEKMGVKVETGGHTDAAIAFGEFIVVSPGIPPSSPVIQSAVRAGKEVICDIELAYRSANIPIIAITGTNGKSTTCALTSHILETAGLKAPACGNFGVPIMSVLDQNPNYLVAEVSSYQAYYSSRLAPKVAVWLNLTPDHIEWHGNLDNYITAKMKLFASQRSDQYAVLNFDDPIVSNFDPPSEMFTFSADNDLDQVIQGAMVMRDYLWYRILGGTEKVCHKDQLKIIGKHNLENALAAISVAAILDVPHAKIVEGVTSFTALEHRLEYAGTVDGVKFFNDSKATNPTSTIKALEAFGDEKLVLIAGGRDKGTSLADLVLSIKKHVAEVILLGEAKDRFAQALAEVAYRNVHRVNSLEDAVELGSSLKKGPVVLSPACASFDMFKDYEERGRVFKDIVRTRLEKVASR